MSDGNDWVLVEDAKLIKSRPMSGLFLIDGSQFWIPWSAIDEDGSISRDGEQGNLYVRKWVARDRNFDAWEDDR